MEGMHGADFLTPEEYLDALATATRVLDDHATALDRLDHPPSLDAPADAPVPPGVGTDLACTLQSAVDAADGRRDFASICAAMHEGARRGSTGRAGRGAVELLAGIGEVLRNVDRLDAGRFALALEAAAERLAPADDGKHPGGFAAVVATVADAALSASDRSSGLADTIVAAADAGLEELERGPVADQRLAAKGVVDAAAAGFLLVLDTLASVVTGEPLPAPPEDADLRMRPVATTAGPTYEVTCRLIPDEGGVEVAVHLEDALRELGEVVLWEVTGDSWRVGVLTTLPGTAVEALVEVGRPREVRIAVVGATAPSPLLAPAPA